MIPYEAQDQELVGLQSGTEVTPISGDLIIQAVR